MAEEKIPEKPDPEKKPEFTAFVQTKKQFEMVLGKFKMYRKLSAGEYGIYLASESFDAAEWKKLAERCHEAGVRCYLMMPRIFRKEAEQYFRKQMEQLKTAGSTLWESAPWKNRDFSEKPESNFHCILTMECIPGTILPVRRWNSTGRTADDSCRVKRA